ncbi:lytic transglycosylase [Arthrobacter sp. MYb211]|uniref:lytic transglycosylase domain-containing protein n=1 Tax=unclassified Arthrobacter TaxID=235627 RepID=UPI000CFC95F1|nr:MULTISPECIES: lytic transglycosylase domain-containing protein [unclassified Arthrobacter]PRA12746.1 lytic transglycosylase [Arthrobacter sp. MYb221]PRC09732.1 lytic transglycosylase [Arthrobacter sp. MYb211]
MPHESSYAAKHALGVVAGAAIPAAVIGSLALAPAVQAAPVPLTLSPNSLSPKSVSPETVKIAEDHIKAHLLASRVSTMGLPAKRSIKEIKVEPGSSLWSIAREYDTSVSELKKLNNLKNDVIIAGKTLKVPGSASSSQEKSKSQSTRSSSYTVKNGDTLGAIAAKHNMSLSSLLSKNDISASSLIFPGDKLTVSGSSKSSSPKSESKNQNSGSSSSAYTVKSGDTLGGIAAKHNMSLSALLSKNNISASKPIFPGDKLTVSGSSKSSSPKSESKNQNSGSSSSAYTVKSGDTLGGIAAKHNMSLSALLSKNNISASKPIFPGDKLTVSGSSKSSSPKSESKNQNSGSSSSTYTVKSGDTLGGIAVKHNMSLSALLSKNNISAGKHIFPGDKLIVSGGSSSSKNSEKKSEPKKSGNATYTVKSGDTLGGIAGQHNMKLSALLNLNPQVSTQSPLKIGEKLKVSGSSVQPNGNVEKKEDRKIGNTFEGRTYPDATVNDANQNKNYLDSVSVPSRDEMKAMIRSTANSMGVDPALAMAHAMQESGFNMRAVSPANALGAMQVIPSTGEWMSSRLGRDLNLLKPQDNVAAGVATIRFNLDNTDSLDDAIASYYQGLGGVRKYGMFEDTKRYVASVKSLMKQYS